MHYSKSNRTSYIFWVINTLLLFNMLKIYDFSLANDKIRLICYAILAISFPLSILCYFLKSQWRVKTKGLNVSIFIYMIIVAVRLILDEEFHWDNWLNCFLVPGVIIECFLLFKDNKFSKIIRYEEIIAYIFAALFLYNKFFLHQGGAGRLNSIFYVLLLLPAILCIDNEQRKNILLFLFAFCTVISLKRTALIIFVTCFFIYLFIEKKTSFKKIIFIIFSIVVFISLVNFIQNNLNIDMMSKLMNIVEDGGSGRSDIYITLIREFFNRPFSDIFCGGGIYAVIDIVGGTAHNDFLEIIYDFGILGFFAYIAIYVNLINTYLNMKAYHYKYRNQFLTSLTCFFFMSIFSHVIMIPTYILHFSIFWGVTINDYSKFRRSLVSISN